MPPALNYSPELVNLLSEADRALGALEGMGRILPNADLLVMPYMRREAVLSSRIEGTQASLSDLFLFEAAKTEPPQSSDVREVANYVVAMRHGLKRLSALPVSKRLVREIHEKLLTGVRGQEQTPGEFRTRQNWVGPKNCRLEDAIYVPPPVGEMEILLDDWEKFAHQPARIPPLIQCAILHNQFESIHPFLDGNGRVGRLLITLFLCEREHLSQPFLYLSGYLEKNRTEYYDRLQAVREIGDWNGWVQFFLQAVAHQANDAVKCAHRILKLKENYRDRLQKKWSSAAVLKLLDSLFLNPYVNVPDAAERMKVSYNAAQSALNKLEKLKIVKEITGQKRNRIFCAQELLRVIENAN
ncbi:MAG: Fic family protein [Limisphaerales bacterium]